MEDPLPLTTLYNTGTVSVGAGSTTVTGIGTAWNTAGLQAGDDFRASGLTVPIASINSPTSITLSRAWPGSALSGANYDIRMVDDGVRSLTASNQLLQALAGGTLTSLGSIAGAANFMPYWTGAGVMSSTALTPLGRTLIGGADAPSMRTTLGLVLTSSATDATAGRVLKVGDSVTLLSGGASNRSTYGGTANAIALTTGAGMSGTIPTGLQLRFRATATNTGSATIAVDGGSAIACRTITGVALPAGYIRTDVDTVARFDGTYWMVDRQVERGGNANGEFTRFADGTLICWVSGLSAIDTDDTVWTFPAAFTYPTNPARAAISGWVPAVLSVPRILQIGSLASGTSVNVRVLSTSWARVAASVHLMATGRWY